MAESSRACPYCGEQIKREAIKCRFCGEMLIDEAGTARATPIAPAEVKEFVVPFPDDSPPRTVPFVMDIFKPFDKNYFRKLGLPNVSAYDCSLKPGFTIIWKQWRDHFSERINEITAEGWSLNEAFEPMLDGEGNILMPWERFQAEEVTVPGMFGQKKVMAVLVGARFSMRRVG